MNALTVIVFCDLDNPITIEVGTWIAEINSEWRGERMLRVCVGIGVKGGCADTLFGSGAANTAGSY
jgi:hypothetical protein